MASLKKRFSGKSASAIFAATFSSALAGRDPGQHVARSARRGLGHQLLQVLEQIQRRSATPLDTWASLR